MSQLIRESFAERSKTVLKVALLGGSRIGKTTLLNKYVHNVYDEDYVETLGVQFDEKTVHLKNVDITISIWDCGGQKEFITLMPLQLVDAQAVFFCFDLTDQSSLFAVRRWWKEAKKEQQLFIPFLIGTKFDLFESMQDNYKETIVRQARKFAQRMSFPVLIFVSSAQGINIKKVFKILVAKVFDLKPKIKEQKDGTKDAILEFEPWTAKEIYPDWTKKRSHKKKKIKKRKSKRTRKQKRKGTSNGDTSISLKPPQSVTTPTHLTTDETNMDITDDTDISNSDMDNQTLSGDDETEFAIEQESKQVQNDHNNDDENDKSVINSNVGTNDKNTNISDNNGNNNNNGHETAVSNNSELKNNDANDNQDDDDIYNTYDDEMEVEAKYLSFVSSIAPAFIVNNPLIVMLGIGEYDTGLPNLSGVSKDYYNIIHTFVDVWNYHIFYKLSDNSCVYSNNIIEMSDKYKLRWTMDEIHIFVESARKEIVRNKHNGLIFVVSSHGDTGKVIYDSNIEQYYLSEIFNLFSPQFGQILETYTETAQESAHLFQIPKIFCVDCCRGDAGAKVEKVKDIPKTDNVKDKEKDKQKLTENANTTTATTPGYTTETKMTGPQKHETQTPVISESKNHSESGDASNNQDSNKNNNNQNQNQNQNPLKKDVNDGNIGDNDEAVEQVLNETKDEIDEQQKENLNETDEKSRTNDSGNMNENEIETYGLKGVTKQQAKVLSAQMSNFCKLWANVEGFSVADGTKNGGLFLRNVAKLFGDRNFISKHSWNDIVLKIREYTFREATLIGLFNFTQVVENEGTLERPITFQAYNASQPNGNNTGFFSFANKFAVLGAQNGYGTMNMVGAPDFDHKASVTLVDLEIISDADDSELTANSIVITNLSSTDDLAILVENEESNEDRSDMIQSLLLLDYDDDDDNNKDVSTENDSEQNGGDETEIQLQTKKENEKESEKEIETRREEKQLELLKQNGFVFVHRKGGEHRHIKAWDFAYITIFNQTRNELIYDRRPVFDRYLYFQNDILTPMIQVKPKCNDLGNGHFMREVKKTRKEYECGQCSSNQCLICYFCDRCKFALCQKCCHVKICANVKNII